MTEILFKCHWNWQFKISECWNIKKVTLQVRGEFYNRISILDMIFVPRYFLLLILPMNDNHKEEDEYNIME